MTPRTLPEALAVIEDLKGDLSHLQRQRAIEQNAEDVAHLADTFKLGSNEARVLLMLHNAAGRRVMTDPMMEMLYASKPEGGTENALHATICHLRFKLTPNDRTAWVGSRGGGRGRMAAWWLTQAGQDAISEALAGKGGA